MNIIDAGLSFRAMSSNNPQSIVIHHIGGEGEWCTVENIHNMHKNENGWAGIGYHYYIRLDGSIFKGRPDSCQGAHVAEFNHNSLGVAFEGNYDERSEMPQAQYNSWCELKEYLFKKYGNMPIYGHREVGSSDCPGKFFPLEKVKNAGIEKEDDELMNVKDIFCEAWYLQAYDDVKESGMNAYEHYTKYGKKEGRKPNIGIPTDWNEAYYLLNNPDVNKDVSSGEGYQSGLHHYLLNGWKENRSWEKPLENEEETEKADTFYRVVTGSYKERENAEEKLEELKNAGFDSFLAVYEKEV